MTAVAERLWPRVESTPLGCWIINGKTRLGYGRIRVDGRDLGAHRVAYELLRGPIPAGLVLDHLCRNRACVNPAHLEPVTHAENIRRGSGASARNRGKTHCVNGHEFTPENTYVHHDARGNPCRQCRTCNRERSRVRWNQFVAERAEKRGAQ